MSNTKDSQGNKVSPESDSDKEEDETQLDEKREEEEQEIKNNKSGLLSSLF